MPERQTFIDNFLAAMDSLTPLIATQRYAAVVNGTGNTTVYGFGECMKDLTQTDCNLCFAQSKTQILRCLPFQKATRGGRLFYDGCYIRYDYYNFFNETLSILDDRTVCGAQEFVGNGSVFSANVNQLVRNLSVESPKFDGFSVGFVNNGNITVYGLGQCWKFVNGSDCEECLANAVSKIGSCTPKEEGRVLNTGCYLRYSTQKFYYNSTNQPVGKSNQGRKLAVTLAATSSALALFLVIAAVVFIVRKNVLKKRRERKQLGTMLATVNKSQLNYSYEVLEKATNYFHNSNKLGQGGSGSVYKVISVKKKFQLLRWEVRYKIILGTAEGLAYLHEELEMRIIHRDIKLSNILLDEDFTARIADFGLARLFPEDKTHISTGIAGTLGYMAPEYVVRGKLTEKADVYSFGVLVIEVVSGKRNNAFTQNSYSILQMVWNLRGTGRACEAVDPALEGKFQEEEASRLLQIGLLCVQASAELRPSMSTVVKMLSDNHELPQPTQPPFLNSSSAEISTFIPLRTYNSQPESDTQSSANNMTESGIDPR
uniref:Protein kinase domain-containing protein n=1 Tax=Fagus sylvatica TaxID=28930 RepID=A0A2N9IQW8_FAGSY